MMNHGTRRSKRAIKAVMILAFLLAVWLGATAVTSVGFQKTETAFASSAPISGTNYNFAPDDLDYIFGLGNIFIEQNPTADEEEIDDYLREVIESVGRKSRII